VGIIRGFTDQPKVESPKLANDENENEKKCDGTSSSHDTGFKQIVSMGQSCCLETTTGELQQGYCHSNTTVCAKTKVTGKILRNYISNNRDGNSCYGNTTVMGTVNTVTPQ